MTNNLEQLAFCISELSEADWQHIFNATNPRLLYNHHNNIDNAPNKMLCQMDTSNILQDIKEYVDDYMRNS